jgi:hypothetical protein
VLDLDAAIAQLAAAGFDLVHRFDPAGRFAVPQRLGLLVGNSRALWPRFAEAMREPTLAAHPHPLDHYTETTITRAFPGAPIRFGHRRYDGAFVPLQQIAVATGLGAMAPSHLVIHPRFGPWFALRAVVLVDGDPPTSTPVARACTCGDACPTALAAALASSGRETWRAWLAVRDACTLRDERYSDDQIRYHYLKVWRPSP